MEHILRQPPTSEIAPVAHARRFACSVVALLFCAATAYTSSAMAQGRMAQPALGFTDSIAELFSNEKIALPLPIRQESAALRAYYLEGAGRPLWLKPQRAAAFIALLQDSTQEGLEPSAYPSKELQKLARVMRLADRLTRAQVELYFSAELLRFARDLKVGRFLPIRIDPKLYWQSKTIDPVRALKMMANAETVAAFVKAWQPQIPEYARLKRVLAAYREVELGGGWPVVPATDAIKPGDDSPAVPAIHARLVISDAELHGTRDRRSTKYDPALVAAMKRFQASHGLEADGIVGKQTLFALNIPVTDRIRQIIVTMERWRWMPEDLGADHIRVNIAGYELRLVRGGRVRERMRVVVGKPFHQTPVFSNEIKYLEFNPYWNVPHSIAVREELPKLQSNPAARAARGFEAVVDGRGVPLTSIDWSQMSRSNFPVKLRQKPGPRNALGRVKFMFPNRFNVYMHDTPAQGLFERSERAFSHGCIRLARPLDLAQRVLRSTRGWDKQKIDRVLASGERTTVSLQAPLPVHLTYATAWLDADGQVNFRPDIYGRDAKLEKALKGRYAAL